MRPSASPATPPHTPPHHTTPHHTTPHRTTPHRNVARLINHSCAPNCRIEVVRGRVWITARRDIPAGAELTFDYGFAFPDWALHPCRCGSPRCPGFIVASAQRWRLRRIPRAERTRRAALGRAR